MDVTAAAHPRLRPLHFFSDTGLPASQRGAWLKSLGYRRIVFGKKRTRVSHPFSKHLVLSVFNSFWPSFNV